MKLREVEITAELSGALKSVIYALISLVIMIIVALIFFIIIAFVVKLTGDFVFGIKDVGSIGLIAAAILAAGVLIGGAGVKYISD